MLSVGNNSLSTTDGLLYLKCLDSLRVLNLCGNPVCSDPEYRPYVVKQAVLVLMFPPSNWQKRPCDSFLLAHLDKLQYLDYALVDTNEAIQAREQYQDELEEMKEVKAIEDAALAREAEQQKYLSMLKDASVITLEVRSFVSASKKHPFRVRVIRFESKRVWVCRLYCRICSKRIPR